MELINLYIHSPLIFIKSAKMIQWEKDSLFIWCLANGYSHVKESNWTPPSHDMQKLTEDGSVT